MYLDKMFDFMMPSEGSYGAVFLLRRLVESNPQPLVAIRISKTVGNENINIILKIKNNKTNL